MFMISHISFIFFLNLSYFGVYFIAYIFNLYISFNNFKSNQINIIKMTENIESHILSKFKIVKKVGSGAYGHVWKVIDNKDGKTKALKKNFDAFNNSTDAQRTYREIMFLLQLSHPNIIKLEQIIRAENDKDIYLVFEHMDADLYALIRQGILEQKHKKWILYQIAKSIYYLHSAGLIHRDLKPSNILINENCDAKLCDFGLVRSIQDEQEQNQDILTQYIATRWYRAPQILIGSKKYTKAIDIWGFGCLLGQLFKGKPLFPGTSTINQIQRVIAWTGAPKQAEVRSLRANNGGQIFKLIHNVKKLNKKQFIPNMPQEAMDLMVKTLQFNPSKRLQIQDILTHPFLKQFYNPKDLKVQTRKVKISIDDNRRLSLKQYRNIIYQQIKLKDTKSQKRQSTDKTLYRIRQSTKKHVLTTESQAAQEVQIPKKVVKQTTTVYANTNTSFNHGNRNAKTLSFPKNVVTKKKSLTKVQAQNPYSKHLKTIQKQWDPMQTKKAYQFKDQIRRTKPILVNKKRSIIETQLKKPKRTFPSQAQINHKLF